MTNINFLPTTSIRHQEKRLWELIKWSPKGKCFDLLSNSFNLFLRKSIEVSLKNCKWILRIVSGCSDLRWLDWIFWGWYLPTLSINYVGMNKDMEKRGRHGYGITRLRFSFIFVFLCSRSFLKKSLKGVCTCYNCLHYGVVWTNSMRAFSKYFEM